MGRRFVSCERDGGGDAAGIRNASTAPRWALGATARGRAGPTADLDATGPGPRLHRAGRDVASVPAYGYQPRPAGPHDLYSGKMRATGHGLASWP
jgi:hypothetical protein